MVTSVTTVPNSSFSDSVRWVWVDCPYRGGLESSSASDDDLKGLEAPPVLMGINFQIRQGKDSASDQSCT